MDQLKVHMVKGCFLVVALEALGLGEGADIETRKREPLSKGADLCAEFLDSLGILAIAGKSDALEILEQLGARLLLQLQSELDSAVQELSNRFEIIFFHAPRGKGCSTETNTTRDLSGGITTDGVLIDGDANDVADLFRLGASEADGAQVPEDEVVVGALSLQTVTLAVELGGQYTSVGYDLLGVRLPGGLTDLVKGGRDTCESVIVGAALAGGENSVVDTLLEVLGAFNVLAEEYKTCARSTEGLVAINQLILMMTNREKKPTWWS